MLKEKKYYKNKIKYIIGITSFTFSMIGVATAAPHLINKKSQSRPLYVEGELLVKAKKGLSLSSSKRFITASGDVVQQQVDKQGLTLVKLAKNETVQSAMARYKATSAYQLVQPNYRYYPTATANDTNYGELWGLKNTGQTVSNPSYDGANPGVAGNDIDAELAWDIQSDCSSVVVAVVDTGINYTHADFVANRWVNTGEIAGNSIDDDGNGVTDDVYGYDAIDIDGDPMPIDGSSHGTHVAGIIGAKGDNNAGTTGVCKSAKIMSIRSLGFAGGSTTTVVAGLNYAVANGAKVVNMSLGGGGNDPAFSTAISDANTSGVVIVVAAGNGDAAGNGLDTSLNDAYPCNFGHSNLVCVAALDQSYALASFSNYGTRHVDIGAPGTNILSTWPGSQLSEDFSTGWAGVDGTGMVADQWARSTCTLSGTLYDTLVNPLEQCGSPYGPYAISQDDRAYKTFDLSTYQGATLEYFVRIRTADTGDTFTAGYANAGGDPFPGGTTLESLSGDEGTSWKKKTYNLEGCISANCSIGFQFKSVATDNGGEGISVILMKIITVETGSTSYSPINGTSMATPYAAGVAALVYAVNPLYTATDVANAVINSGESTPSLESTTSTGKALNAYNAVRYIQPPIGLTAVLQ